jgi:hypothetical protein
VDDEAWRCDQGVHGVDGHVRARNNGPGECLVVAQAKSCTAARHRARGQRIHFLLPVQLWTRQVRDGMPVPMPREEWRSLRMEDQFDAVLYLGPRSAMTSARVSPARCADQPYLKMRLRRMALMPGSEPEIDRLKRYCAAQSK